MPINSDRIEPLIRISASTLTTVLTPAYPRDCWIEYLGFMNRDINDIAVTVKDGNGIALLGAITMPAGALSPVGLPEGGLFFAKGMAWSAGSNALVDAWVRLRSA